MKGSGLPPNASTNATVALTAGAGVTKARQNTVTSWLYKLWLHENKEALIKLQKEIDEEMIKILLRAEPHAEMATHDTPPVGRNRP